MRNYLISVSVITVTCSTAVLAATPQSEERGLDEIVVTAQRRSENVQKVPIAITALAPTQLAVSGVNTTQELAVAVPGLQLLSIANAITPRLRGVGSGVTAAGIDGAVAGYVDGVYYGFAPDLAFDFFDVTQVSVLKGPQGTLFGRNATGGVLQIATRDPTREYHGTINTSIDNYLTWRSNVYVGGGVSDTVRAGLSVHYTHQGEGWGRNLATGNDNHKIDHDVQLRGKIFWEPSSDTVVKLAGDYTDREGAIAPNFTRFPGYDVLFPAARTSNPWDTNSRIDSVNQTTLRGGSLTVEQDFGFAKLTNITAYRAGKNRFVFDSAATPTPSLDLVILETDKQFTQELQLTSPSVGSFNWTTGFFYFGNTADQEQLSVFFRGPLINPFTQIRFPAEQHTKSISGYGQGTYNIDEHTRLTVGARYTYEKRTFDGSLIGTFPDSSTLPLFETAPDAHVTYKKPTWRISLDRDVTDDVIAYASYNRGFKSGGFNIRDPSNPPYFPEKLDAYEVGFKSTLFDRAARLNVAGFYYDYSNLQVPRFGSNGTLTVLNGAKARIYGLDADYVAEVAEGLTLRASGNWLHAKFLSFPGATFSIPNPGNFGATLIAGDAKGDYLPYSPEFTYSLGVDYKFNTAIGQLGINLNDNYNSGFYGEADNRLRQSSYHLLNSSLSWKAKNEQVSARLFVNNILNKAVASQMASLAVAYLADYSNPPRIYGVSIQYDF
jgi:outer membrane receptor protein involved in Fe transport